MKIRGRLLFGLSAAIFLAASDGIVSAAGGKNNSGIYSPLYEKYSPDTPRPPDKKARKSASQLKFAALSVGATALDDDWGNGFPTGMCGPGAPCVNKACCSKEGVCGYSPDHCGAGNCDSNCDAKAECGKYGASGKQTCPLNVCCSEFGFCGTSDDFCDVDGCQKSFGSCGPVKKPSCGGSSSKQRAIGYYEAWAPKKPCDKVDPEDLPLEGFTHINFAFAFFDPKTFEISPMDSNTGSLYRRFTNLKKTYLGLETWISVGGWSFNDPGNTPDTRRAFGDMAATKENRQKFIKNLLKFMGAYNFDGVDLDWEYPAAEDRGGKPEDTANFVQLVKEMKEALYPAFGVTVTLPASFWYLRGFDVKKMEPYLDWFNIMTYDIHGVWDSDIKSLGPIVRPHTNLTEVDEGLSLLWRAGVSPSNVVLGIGYYGRSFTLADPTCNKPGCRFTAGGKKGECSGASGILTNAEIYRILDEKKPSVFYDDEAAVNWISWDSDQWISYDDEQSISRKKGYANSRCLGGIMIWAVDQDISGNSGKNLDLDESNNLAKIDNNMILAGSKGKNGLILSMKQVKAAADVSSTCYTTFCGGQCAPGYLPMAAAFGQVAGLEFNTTCDATPDQTGRPKQSICCLEGINDALRVKNKICQWRGYRGVGMSCNAGCEDDEVVLAENNEPIIYNENGRTRSTEAKPCLGGFQSLCCPSFSPVEANTKTPLLLGGDDTKVVDKGNSDGLNKRDLEARGATGCIATALVIGGSTWELGPVAWVADLAFVLICLKGAGVSQPSQSIGGYKTRSGGVKKNPYKPPKKADPTKPKGVKTDANGNQIYGRYTKANYDTGTSTTCQVTYTCDYNLGFDQVCDNQRYGVNEMLGGKTVYAYLEGGPRPARQKAQWVAQHGNQGFRHGWFPNSPQVAICEADEFPMDSLDQPRLGSQAIRLVDRVENQSQGQDWNYWLWATWYPCSALIKSPPPVTWRFGVLPPTDPRMMAASNKVIRKYGFNLQGNQECFATYVRLGGTTTVSDHGFRVHSSDVLFDPPYNWPKQNYKFNNPGGESVAVLPTDVASLAWMRKRDYVCPAPANAKQGRGAQATPESTPESDVGDLCVWEDVPEPVEAPTPTVPQPGVRAEAPGAGTVQTANPETRETTRGGAHGGARGHRLA